MITNIGKPMQSKYCPHTSYRYVMLDFNKYRIPTLDEFVLGFKYELDCECVLTTIERVEGKEPWASCTVNSNTDLEIIETSLRCGLIRVKV